MRFYFFGKREKVFFQMDITAPIFTLKN